MKKVKILHVISSTNPKYGGPIEGINQIAKEISTLGYEVHCVCCDPPNSPWISLSPIKIYALGHAFFKYRYSPKLIPWLQQNLDQFDIVICNGIWQFTSYATSKVAKSKNIPYYIFTHGMLDPWFNKAYPLKHLKKWVYWLLIEYRVIRDANKILFTCDEERLLARKSFFPYQCNEVIAHYGIAGAPPDSRHLCEYFLTKNPELRGKRLILFLSRIHEKKGCDLLIKAFSEAAQTEPDLHLIMAGPEDSDRLKLKLTAQANKLGISDHISWIGMISGDEKWGAFYAAEVFCLPSHQENFGIVVAEALSCSKPVLISNKINIFKEIEAYGAGFVNEDTFDGTYQGLKQWLATTTEMKQQMQLAAFNCFKELFFIAKVIKTMTSLAESREPPLKSNQK